MKKRVKPLESESPVRTISSKWIHIIAISIKIILIIYGEYHDLHSQVKYTDIDYKVYTDAARYITENESPYLRHTYRYTPLLAYICTLNIYYFDWMGKALFCCVDSIAALILEAILNQTSPFRNQKYTQILLALWVFNPMSIAVSTRGNADTIISCLVLLVLWLLLNKKHIYAGFFFGLVVHFKIYPILYALPMYFYIDMNKASGLFTKNRLIFTVISAGLFLGLMAIFYQKYGWEFLYETYLYHLTRKDNRHNFSVYFYYIYLNFEYVSVIQSILTFVPQMLLVVLSGYKFYKDLPFCCFMQTFWFVVFNKVCTAQYFIWYMSLLPLILARNKLFFKGVKFLGMWIVWLVFELLWNLTAYYLEHQGLNDFLLIWIASLFFFLINVYLGYQIMKEQELTTFQIIHEKTQ